MLWKPPEGSIRELLQLHKESRRAKSSSPTVGDKTLRAKKQGTLIGSTGGEQRIIRVDELEMNNNNNLSGLIQPSPPVFTHR